MGILSPVSKMLMKRISKDFGQVSKTQRLALEAGTAVHEEQLFTGKPDWNVLNNLPAPKLSPEAEAFLKGPVEELCRMVTDWDVRNSEEQDMPEHVWKFLRENRFFGMVIPKEHGGLGFNALEHAEIVAKIGTHSMTAALTVMVPNSLGPGELIAHYGTDEQKKEILPKLAVGELFPCFALTEPFAGSDAFGGMKTTGTVYKEEGTGELKIRIEGEKRYITLAPKSNLPGVAMKLKDPENLLGKGTEPGITCALLRKDTKGMSIGNRHRPMDIPFMNGPIFLNGAEISVNDIIGGPAMAGRGDEMLMECLGVGRSISLPNMSLAAGRLVSTVAGAYARTREQFGFSLSDMKALHNHLSRIAGQTYMIDAARTALAQRVDGGEKPSVGSAILKVHATTAMADIVRAANRLQGGKAIMQGPHNMMGMIHWGVPIAETVEGDNVMTESVVVYAQGLKKCHPTLGQEIAAAEKGDAKAFESALFSHVKNMFGNIGRAFAFGLLGGGGAGAEGADAYAQRAYKKLNRLCAAFNVAVNVTAAVMGGGIQKEQTVSRRLGRVYSNVLLAAYTLRQYQLEGSKADERPVVDWVVQSKLYEAEQEMKDLLDNYPNKLAAAFMRAIIFPRGLLHKKPSDKLEAEVASLLTRTGSARDRLTRGTYLPLDDARNPVAQAERTLRLIETVETPIIAKLKSSMDRKAFKALMFEPDPLAIIKARNLLPPEDIEKLDMVAKEKRRVVDVDNYAPGENFRKGISANPL